MHLTIIPEWRNEEKIYLTSNIPKNILLHKWIEFQLNPLLSLRQLVRSRSLFFILTRARDTGPGPGIRLGQGLLLFSQFSSTTIFVYQLRIFLEILDLHPSVFSCDEIENHSFLDARNNIWTCPSVVMYSPTISIRITDADTRGRDPGPESRGETRTQNTHREKLRQEGLQITTSPIFKIFLTFLKKANLLHYLLPKGFTYLVRNIKCSLHVTHLAEVRRFIEIY